MLASRYGSTRACVLPPSSVTALELLLLEHEVPVGRWGKGAAKAVQDLLCELRQGESRLEVDTENQLLRRVSVVGIDVLFPDHDRGTLRLVEEEQVFENGRRRVRNLRTSLGEKQLPGEAPREAAARALEEELGLPGTDLGLRQTGSEVVKSPSESYPGLQSERHLTYFECVLPPSLYFADGYEERQVGKTTSFSWRAIADRSCA